MKKILLLGGSGLLGQELLKINPSMIALPRQFLDITNFNQVSAIKTLSPDIIIHCAAILTEEDKTKLIETNIIGTANLALVCNKLNCRLVYLSTDYIYPGDNGNYKEDDPILPFNYYAWTKLGGECAVKGVDNHLIIRTTFGPSKFPYTHAYEDAWRSKDYIDVIAPMIYEAVMSDLTGVLNIGTERKTMYEYARQRNPDVLPSKIEDFNFRSAKDTSLDLTKWNNYKNGKANM